MKNRLKKFICFVAPVVTRFASELFKPIFSFSRAAIIFISIILCAQNAYAMFDLQVTPRRGGNSIRFEGAKPGSLLRNEEMTISLFSDNALQYRLYQTVYEPLTNEMGDTIPQGALIVFSPSNPLGTLRTQLETPVTMGQMPVYTSNAAGDSDEFVLVFNVRVPENQPGGIYRSQIQFTSELVNAQGGVSPRTITMDIRVEINPSFRFTVQNSAGGKELSFGKLSKNRPRAIQILNVEVESNFAAPYRVVQQMTEPFVSQDGTLLDESAVQFSVVGGKKGSSSIGARAPLPTASTVVYTSGETGVSDVIELQYQTTPEAMQKAGVYAGVLSFRIESTSSILPAEIVNIPVRIEAESIFYIDAELQQGSELNFGIFRTGQEKQESRTNLTIYSNLGQPYQVSQILTRKLTSAEGASIPKEHFLLFGSEASTGTLHQMSPTPVQEGEMPVFTSDKNGTPEKFALNYILTVPKDARSGKYNSETIYSITTL